MRLTVTYDIHGNITTLVASPPESPVAYLEIKPGQRMTEIEEPNLRPDLGIERINEHLSDLIQNHRIDTGSARNRFTKKHEVATDEPSAPCA